MTAIVIKVPGPLVPWQRAATLAGRRITPKSQRAYQSHVAACARAALLGVQWDRGVRYHVSIGWVPQDARRRDLDNAAKTLLDALNGIAWNDDSQIDRLSVVRQSPSKTPWVTMTVEAIEQNRRNRTESDREQTGRSE